VLELREHYLFPWDMVIEDYTTMQLFLFHGMSLNGQSSFYDPQHVQLYPSCDVPVVQPTSKLPTNSTFPIILLHPDGSLLLEALRMERGRRMFREGRGRVRNACDGIATL